MEQFSWIQKILLWGIPLLFAITVHEVAHGWIASRCGDPTAKMLGRLTLNPIRHIDLIGTIIVPAVLFTLGGFIFGWAKPVPITWENLRHPRRDMALVALAGPVANLLMLVIWAVIARLALTLSSADNIGWAIPMYYMGMIGVSVNIMLLVLNLLPLPPLDGSRIVASFLHGKTAYYYSQIERYGFFILLALLALGVLSKILLPLTYGLNNFISALFGIQ